MRAYKRLEVKLPKPDERSLVQLLRSGVQQVRVVLRSLALLQLSGGDSAPAIARRLRLTPKTVRDIGKRYLEGGVDRALYERPRQGAKPILSPTERQRIIAMTCSDAPEGRLRGDYGGIGTRQRSAHRFRGGWLAGDVNALAAGQRRNPAVARDAPQVPVAVDVVAVARQRAGLRVKIPFASDPI